MGEPVFPLSDFLYAIKRNWKQALPVGILDAIICLLIPYNIYVMLISGGNYLASLMLWMNIALFFIYTFMRFYIYVQLVSFDLSIKKIFKNSFSFALLGWKRNFMALLGIVIMLLLEYVFLLFGGVLLRLFSSDAAVVEHGLVIIRTLVPLYFTYITIEILSGAVRGTGDTLIPTLMTLTGVCLLRVVWISFVVPACPGLKTVLYSYPVTWVITSVMYIVYYFKGRWMERGLKMRAE